MISVFLNINFVENSKTSDSKADDGDDDVPELVEDFDEKSRLE